MSWPRPGRAALAVVPLVVVLALGACSGAEPSTDPSSAVDPGALPSGCTAEVLDAMFANGPQDYTVVTATEFPAGLPVADCAVSFTVEPDDLVVAIYRNADQSLFDNAVTAFANEGYQMEPVTSDLHLAGSIGQRGEGGVFIYLGTQGALDDALTITILGD